MTEPTTGAPPGAPDLTAQWKAAIAADAEAKAATAAVEVTLPSGLSIRARQLALYELFDLGRVPDALTPIVYGYIDAASGKGGADAVESVKALIDARWFDFVAVIDFVWLQAVVEPVFCRTVAEAIQTGAIPLPKVGVADRVALFNWAQGMGTYWATDAASVKEGAPAAVGASVAAFPDGESALRLGVAPDGDGLPPGPAGDGRD